jgi:hypothetical protein
MKEKALAKVSAPSPSDGRHRGSAKQFFFNGNRREATIVAPPKLKPSIPGCRAARRSDYM